MATIQVEIKDGDNLNWALKKFKRQCDAYGLLKEYRKRKAHRKPSVREKEKTESALKRRRKESLRSRSYSKI